MGSTWVSTVLALVRDSLAEKQDCVENSVVHLTLDGVNGKWRWRRNLCQFDGENSKIRRQSSEFSDGNAVIYDRYLRSLFTVPF